MVEWHNQKSCTVPTPMSKLHFLFFIEDPLLLCLRHAKCPNTPPFLAICLFSLFACGHHMTYHLALI